MGVRGCVSELSIPYRWRICHLFLCQYYAVFIPRLCAMLISGKVNSSLFIFLFFFLMFTAFRLNVFVFPYVHFRVSKLSSQKKKKNWIGIGLILNVYIDFREETYFSYEVSLSKSRMSLCLFGSSMPYSFYIAVGYILVTLIPGYFLCCRYKNGAIGSECLLCEALCWMLGLQQ